ncbi:MAG: DUF2889 domain-containing protein [Actinomycetota bacterium]
MGIFSRFIEIEIDEDPEGRVFLIGTLKDTRLGQPVHHLVVKAAVDLVDGRIHSLEGEMPHVPFEDCRHALRTLERLVGEEIKPGFTQLVRDVVGSPEGCTHLSVLVTNLGHASVQGRGALLVHRFGGGEEAVRLMREQAIRLGIMGSCYAWRADGPLMRRMREEMGP